MQAGGFSSSFSCASLLALLLIFINVILIILVVIGRFIIVVEASRNPYRSSCPQSEKRKLKSLRVRTFLPQPCVPHMSDRRAKHLGRRTRRLGRVLNTPPPPSNKCMCVCARVCVCVCVPLRLVLTKGFEKGSAGF